jgi:hypothetical protein
MPQHHPLRATAGVVLAVLLTLVGGLLTAAPAQATLYDSVVVDDPVGDLQGERFPDVRTAGFKANRFSVTTSALEERYRARITRPDGTEFVCRRCTVRVREARRRIVFIIPWDRIGSPEYVRISPSYVSAGYVMDTADKPYRVLY